MKPSKSKLAKILIGILCVLLLAGVVTLALYLDSLLPNPVFGVFDPNPDSGNDGGFPSTTPPRFDNADDQPVTPPEDLPSSVDIPTTPDPNTGVQVINFPCEVPGYQLRLERLAPYKGMFVEDGTNANVENVAMLLVSNQGDYPIEYAQIVVQYGSQMLTFDISALPVGEQLVVQEKTGKSIADAQVHYANALVVRRAAMDMARDQVQVTDNGDNTLTITNLTDVTIPAVRVFYKYYMEDEKVFVGGIAFTVQVTDLEPNGSVTIQPSHYTSQSGRVVMVQTYESEV